MENQILRRAPKIAMVLHIIMVHMVMVSFIMQFAFVRRKMVVISVFLLSVIFAIVCNLVYGCYYNRW